ncbi:hypothetical protein KXD40_007168 [Peronospora effusa]|nr:hypothetical protein KXD40_007168 [Peronospora effusa]
MHSGFPTASSLSILLQAHRAKYQDSCHVKGSPNFLRTGCDRARHLLISNRGNPQVNFCGCRVEYAAFVSCSGRDEAALEAYHGHGDD